MLIIKNLLTPNRIEGPWAGKFAIFGVENSFEILSGVEKRKVAAKNPNPTATPALDRGVTGNE